MKVYLGIFLILNSIQQIVLLNIVEINSPGLLGLFTRSDDVNIIKTDPLSPKIPAGNTEKETIFKFKAFFEEQCAIKCLRNMNCVKYSFSAENECQISLLADFKRYIQFTNPEDQETISKNINCNLNKCSNGVYCSANSLNSNEGTCLCHSSAESQDCFSKPIYQLGTWSDYSQCSADCENINGFKKRSRECTKISVNGTSTIKGLDWLCNKDSLAEQYDSVSCSIKKCESFTPWSEWSRCSKICGGYAQRTRECVKGVDCDKQFLKQIKECSLKVCSSIEIVLDQTELSSTNTDILKRGLLKFQDLYTYKYLPVFSHTDDQKEINKIGHVVCSEFGFKELNSISAQKKASLRYQYNSDEEYENFLDNEAINGIVCDGTEKTLKDCRADYKITQMFELVVECTYDGYWSHWSQWSECSVTCGAGARTRSRACNNPLPSISESNGPNGISCPPAKKNELSNCFMAKCEDNEIIF